MSSSPRSKARLAGTTYWLSFLALLGTSVGTGLVIAGDASATAKSIQGQEPSFWLGFALDLISTLLFVGSTALIYGLFQTVNRSVALTAMLFSFLASSLHAVRNVFLLGAMLVLRDGHALSGFTVDQQQGLSLLFLNWNAQIWDMALVFFGAYWLLVGYLVIRSTFVPRLLGGVLVVSGVSWLTFLAPPLAHAMDPVIRVVGILGAFSLMGWLLVMGVNGERRGEQARAAEEAGLT